MRRSLAHRRSAARSSRETLIGTTLVNRFIVAIVIHAYHAVIRERKRTTCFGAQIPHGRGERS